MSGSLDALAGRIRRELVDLQAVAGRALRIWSNSPLNPDDYRVDAAAVNLHGLYSGIEKVFEQIAQRVDGFVPEGATWHQDLLKQMASDVPGTRAAVVSSDLFVRLDRLRGFRHVVRNVYTYILDPRQVQLLIDDLPTTVATLVEDLSVFAETLEDIARAE